MLGCVFLLHGLIVTIAHRHIFFNFTFQCTMTVVDANVTGSKSETVFRRALKILGLQGKDWVPQNGSVAE